MAKQRKTLEDSLKVVPSIKNRMRRINLMLRLKYELRKQRKSARKQRKRTRERLGPDAPPPLKPKTIESMREADETIVTEDMPEIVGEEAIDEFAQYYKGEITPHLMITTSRKPSRHLKAFVSEMKDVFASCDLIPREKLSVAEVQSMAIEQGYTDVLVVTERLRKPDGLWIVHLPEGPTAYFRLTNVWKRKKIPNHGVPTRYDPELILNNFDTRLGLRLGRMLAALFPKKPEFRGRRLVTFHNQRDFIFLRHHRYIFKENGQKVSLQEVGPRVTLKLLSLQAGLFDPKFGQYEFKYQAKFQVSRKKFFI